MPYGRDDRKPGSSKKGPVSEVGKTGRFQTGDHLGQLSKMWEEELRLCQRGASWPWSPISLEHPNKGRTLVAPPFYKLLRHRRGCDYCYLLTGSNNPETLRYDFHIFNWAVQKESRSLAVPEALQSEEGRPGLSVWLLHFGGPAASGTI